MSITWERQQEVVNEFRAFCDIKVVKHPSTLTQKYRDRLAKMIAQGGLM